MKEFKTSRKSLRVVFPVAMAMMLLPLATLSVAAYVSLLAVAGELDELAVEVRHEIVPSQEIKSRVNAAHAELASHIDGESGARARFQKLREKTDQEFAALIADPPDLTVEIKLAREAQREWREASKAAEKILAVDEPSKDSRVLQENEIFERHIANLAEKLSTLQEMALQQSDGHLQDSANTQARLKTLIATIFIVGILIALAGGIGLARSILRPLQVLAAGAARLGSGDLSSRIVLDHKNELGQLGSAFNEMAAQLADSQDSLRQSEDRYRDIVENSRDLICTHDMDGRILSVNCAFRDLLGYGEERLIGHRIAEYLRPDSSITGQFEDYLEQLKREGHATGLMHVVSASGEIHVLEYNNSLRCDGVSTAIARGMARDVTERIRTQQELAAAREAAEAASRAKSDFLARMSHEIRTPLNGVIGMTELALETQLNSEQREFLETAKKSADTLLAVINDILDFSKIEARKLELESIPFRLRDTLDDMMATLAVRAQQKGLELACDVQPEIPDVLVGDPGRLRQILINLVGNAIKFTRTGEIVVRVVLQSEIETAARLQFSVRDTGPGIPPDRLDTIFQPFEQADGTITRRYGGTGLGLAIATQLAELMGGTLGVESMPGEGSTFSFTAEFPIGNLAAAPSPVNLRDLPALVADDNDTNRRILEKVLGGWGMQVTTADSGRAALTAIQWAASAQKPFRVALVDSQMPMMDGFALVAKLRKEPLTASLPVIMMTSAGQSGDAARCRELGVAAYLTKPVRQSQLLEAIFAALGIAGTETVPQPLVTQHSLRVQERSLHILLAEDNPVNQVVAQRVLEKWGHSLRKVNNGKEALAALETESFDLVLMDIEMPEMDGLQATTAVRVREQVTGGHVPIIAMTAHALKGDRERCLASGMDGYVSKPVSIRELHDAMENLILLRKSTVVETHPQDSPAIEPAFDRTRALQNLSGSEALFAEVTAVFLEHSPQVLAEIRAAIAERDPRKMECAAHTLRGSVSLFGAEGAMAAAQKLESLGHFGTVEGAGVMFANLQTEISRLTAALTSPAGTLRMRDSAEAVHGDGKTQ